MDKSSKVASPPVAGSDAYGTDEMYNEDVNDGDWDLNYIASAPGGGKAVRAREVTAIFKKVQKGRREAGLRVPYDVLNVLSERAEAPVVVPISSTLASSYGTSVLSSHN